MADVFLSYANEDRSIAYELVRLLERQQWTVWWDRSIPLGSDYEATIETELESAKCVIVVWSRHSISSRWVRSEAEDAATRGILIPVLVEDVRIPLAFRSMETARLVDWPNREHTGEVRKLVHAIRDVLSENTGRLPEPVPGHFDPTLSERVARRVLDALRKVEHRERNDE